MENTVLEKISPGPPEPGNLLRHRRPWRWRACVIPDWTMIVDTEHSPAGIESAAAQIAAAQGAGLTALAWANEISCTAALRLLDVGAQGWWSPAWRPWRKSGSWSGMPSSRLWGTGASAPPGTAAGATPPMRSPFPAIWETSNRGDAAAAPVRNCGLLSTLRRSPLWTV